MGRAVQIETLANGLFDNNGQPLSGGKVYTYNAGTTTPKLTWTDQLKAVASANPIILDSNGRALVFGDGVYKLVATTSADVAVFTEDNLQYLGSDETVLYGGSSSGSPNAYSVSLSPAITAYEDGQRIVFVANFTNTGACTLNVNGKGAVPIVKGNNRTLGPNEIFASQIVEAVYVGGYFKLTAGELSAAPLGPFSYTATVGSTVSTFMQLGNGGGDRFPLFPSGYISHITAIANQNVTAGFIRYRLFKEYVDTGEYVDILTGAASGAVAIANPIPVTVPGTGFSVKIEYANTVTINPGTTLQTSAALWGCFRL